MTSPESPKDVLTLAKEEFGVDLDDAVAVRNKLLNLHRDIEKQARLRNLWDKRQEEGGGGERLAA